MFLNSIPQSGFSIAQPWKIIYSSTAVKFYLFYYFRYFHLCHLYFCTIIYQRGLFLICLTVCFSLLTVCLNLNETIWLTKGCTYTVFYSSMYYIYWQFGLVTNFRFYTQNIWRVYKTWCFVFDSIDKSINWLTDN